MPARALKERVEILEQKVGKHDQWFDAIARRFEERDRTMRVLHEEVLTCVKEGDEESRRLMRVLHEEVLTRISLLQESWGGKKR